MRTERKWMHIDRADEVAVAAKPAAAARPSSAFGLGLVPATGTPAAGSSFAAGEAQDAGLLGFMGEVVDVFAVFPHGHATIVVTAGVPAAHAMRVADEERSHLPLDAKIDHLSRGFVAQVADTPLGPPTNLVLGALEFLPTTGVFGAAALEPSDLPQLLAALPLEAANAASSHDEGLAGVRGHGGEVNFPQVHGRLHRAGCLLRLLNLDTDMQFKAPIPDERAGPALLREIKGQDERWAASAHRQDDAPLLLVDGLGGPLHRVEPFGAPGILHAYLRVLPAQGMSRLNVGKKGMDDLLHRLGAHGEPAFGGLLQLTLPRPRRISQTRLLVRFHAEVPHAGCFLLRLLETPEEQWRKMAQTIYPYCFHMLLFVFFARNAVMSRMDRCVSGVAFTPSPQGRLALPLLFVGGRPCVSGKSIVLSNGTR